MIGNIYLLRCLLLFFCVTLSLGLWSTSNSLNGHRVVISERRDAPSESASCPRLVQRLRSSWASARVGLGSTGLQGRRVRHLPTTPQSHKRYCTIPNCESDNNPETSRRVVLRRLTLILGNLTLTLTPILTLTLTPTLTRWCCGASASVECRRRG